MVRFGAVSVFSGASAGFGVPRKTGVDREILLSNPVIVPSIRQLASHLGVSHTALNGHYASGKFSSEPGGGFDVDKVRAALAASSDISQPARPAASRQRSGDIPIEGVGGGPYEVFNRARAAKELAIAKEKQVDLRERQEELLEAADVERAWTNNLTRCASRLLLVPDKLAPRLAAMTDVLEIRAEIDKEIRAALRAAARICRGAADCRGRHSGMRISTR